MTYAPDIPFDQPQWLRRGFSSELEFCDAWCAKNVGATSFLDTSARVESLYAELFGDS